jgi:hypothetical protein
MNNVKVIEDEDGDRGSRPYRVMVNGTILINRRGSHRRFESSFTATIAGCKEVDRRKAGGEIPAPCMKKPR